MRRGVGEITGAAALGCVGATELALAVTAAVFWLMARRLRRQAALERASLQAGPLRLEAGAVALAGIVEAAGEEPPVSVVIEERRDASDWHEVRRVVEARPFVLRLACGTAVEVVPGPAPLLRDALDAVASIDGDRRRRAARLSRGEQVFVRGVLRVPGSGGSPYRADVRAVLEAPRRRPMVLSTEALSGELERRAGAHMFRAVMLLLPLGASALLYLGFHVRALLHLVAGGEAPAILFDVYVWIMVIAGSAIAGALISAWKERPWHARGRARP
jgi:hypothetical protein